MQLGKRTIDSCRISVWMQIYTKSLLQGAENEHKGIAMEIDGCDLVIYTGSPKGLMKEMLEAIMWEDPIFEDDGDHGVFVYPDAESKELWDNDNASGVAPMIYFIFGEDYLSVTSDEIIIEKIKGLI